MQTVQRVYQRGPQGRARVVSNKKSLTVTMVDTGQQLIFDIASLGYTLPTPFVAGDYAVKISFDLTKLEAIAPWNGSVVTRFTRFASPQDPRTGAYQLPVPKPPRDRVGKTRDGRTYDKNWLQFTALMEVMEPAQYAGMIVPAVLHYEFVPDPNGQAGPPVSRSKYVEQLIQFLDKASGDFTSLSIPFSDNILPPLEKQLQERNRLFQCVLENGWVVAFAEAIQPPTRAAKNVAKTPKTTAKKKK